MSAPVPFFASQAAFAVAAALVWKAAPARRAAIVSVDPGRELEAVTPFVVPDAARGATARVAAAKLQLAEDPCAASSPARQELFVGLQLRPAVTGSPRGPAPARSFFLGVR